MDVDALAKQFSDFYYPAFDSDRSQLGNFYRAQSLLTFEGATFTGSPEITEKLVGLPFQKVAHRISTLDAQPNGMGNGAIVMVTGELLVDDETNAQRFSQVFHIAQDGDSFFVLNDVFRLNYS